MIRRNANGSVIQIGKQGENLALEIAFPDSTVWGTYYGGDGKYVLLHQRPGEEAVYQCNLYMDNGIPVWRITSADTAIASSHEKTGRAELRYLIGDTIVKSCVYRTLIAPSLTGTDSEPPDPAGKAWYEKIESEIGDLSKLETEETDNLVSAINEAAKSGLPEITDDTKDMALYNDGEKAEWRKIGSDIFVITITEDKNESTGYKADRTFKEIADAINNNMFPICIVPENLVGVYEIGVCYYESRLRPPVSSAPTYFIFQNVWRIGTSAVSASLTVRISSYDTTDITKNLAVMRGSSAKDNGTNGMVPRPLAGDQNKFLRGDATWADVGGYFEIRVTKSGDTYTADKTYNEIKVAIESGLTPVCRMKRHAADAILDDVFYYYNWQIIDGNPDANAFTFNNMGNGASRFIGIYNSGTVYYFDDMYNFYTLPTATSTTLGGVKPVAKTDAMMQDVGVDENGKLYTEPAEGGSDLSLGITGATIGQIVKITAVDTDGKPTAWKPVDDRLPSVTINDDGNILIVRQISEFEAAYVLEHMPNINDFINLGITDASPGQFAKVLAVDEFGQPISWKAVDMPSGGGSPSSALICDVTLAEAVQAVSQTLEHNFYALHCIVHCGTSGVTLLVDADGTAQKGYINMLLDTVAQSDLSKLCGATYFGGTEWKTHLMHAIWSPDRTYFEQAMNATLENRTNATVYQSFGGIANMKGTIGPSAVSPDSGRTVNIVAPVNTLLNAGVRVIIWGEYYE